MDCCAAALLAHSGNFIPELIPRIFSAEDAEAAGPGGRRGPKCEHVRPSLNDGAGVSIGFNCETPLHRPAAGPHGPPPPFSTLRGATRPLGPVQLILGYASGGADWLDRTPMSARFGRNQLHSNSLIKVAGAAREWPRFRASLAATVTRSRWVSNENKTVYAVRPKSSYARNFAQKPAPLARILSADQRPEPDPEMQRRTRGQRRRDIVQHHAPTAGEPLQT